MLQLLTYEQQGTPIETSRKMRPQVFLSSFPKVLGRDIFTWYYRQPVTKKPDIYLKHLVLLNRILQKT